MNNATHMRTRNRGHTLLEMLLSLTLLAMVSASIGSAVMFAAKAAPGEGSYEATLAADSVAMDRIAEELAQALYVIDQSQHAVTFVVNDRTGDGVPDRLRYAWSGNEGDPLTYQLNSQDQVTLIETVEVFDLSYAAGSSVVTLPGALQRGDTEQLLSYETSLVVLSTGMGTSVAMGQRYTPTLSGDALAYEPTRLRFYASQQGNTNGQFPVAIRGVSGHTPTDTVYVTQTVLETDLPTSANWAEVAFSNAAWAPAGEEHIFTLGSGTGSGSLALINYHALSTPYSTSNDKGATWGAGSGGSLLHALYGYEIVQGPDIQVTREHLSAVTILLQSVSDNRSPLMRRVSMLQAPKQLDAFAMSDFKADPTVMDWDADGSAEWVYDGGNFPDAQINGGRWTPNSELIFTPDSLSDADVITVCARMSSTSVRGPTIYGPNTINTDGKLLPLAVELRGDGAGGQELAVYNDTTLATEALVIPGLPTGSVDVQITLVPGEDFLSIRINREEIGSILMERIDDPGTVSESVRIGSSGGVSHFSNVRVEVGGSYAFSTEDGSVLGADALDALLGALGL